MCLITADGFVVGVGGPWVCGVVVDLRWILRLCLGVSFVVWVFGLLHRFLGFWV